LDWGKALLQGYFKKLYRRTMEESYARARQEIAGSIRSGGKILDCGAGSGHLYDQMVEGFGPFEPARYFGIEWVAEEARRGRARGLQIQQGDLNQPLPYEDGTFSCVFGLSVLEHLLYGCRYLQECRRVLAPGGKLVLLTPNISTYFTAALILAGRMPSSGPHPDSSLLVDQEELFRVREGRERLQVEDDTPMHRHLVVFSYRVLRGYLRTLGFAEVRGYGYGVYPFPNFMQPLLERIDPYHCHQMVFVARR
jgi:SAM-dependent methyltransferase